MSSLFLIKKKNTTSVDERMGDSHDKSGEPIPLISQKKRGGDGMCTHTSHQTGKKKSLFLSFSTHDANSRKTNRQHKNRYIHQDN